jgi:1,2-diacylglycerol 3-alpha-glucosyltransferase
MSYRSNLPLNRCDEGLDLAPKRGVLTEKRGLRQTRRMKQRLSICMISDDFLPAATGVGIHLKLVAPELVKRGHQVSVITTRRKGEPAVENWQGVTIYRLFTIKVFDFYQALPSGKRIYEIFRLEKPDVVHQHYASFMMARVSTIARFLKIPQVTTYHFSAEVLTQPWVMRPFRGLIRKLMVRYHNRTDLLIAPSKNLVNQLSHEGIRVPIHYLTNPIVFGDCANTLPAERKKEFTILYAGRLGTEKNISFLIKSFAQLLKSTPQAQLWIAGRGPEGPALQNLCAALDIQTHVQFLGFLDHPTLAGYYKACDVFVLPSLQEAQALVVMEAMWFSRPVIVTNAIVSANELVNHEVNGYIVDANSVDDLSGRLQTLAENPQLRKTQGEASRKLAQTFRPEPVVQALEEIYLSLSKKGNSCRENTEPLLFHRI